jgi:hypothetical protein
VHLLLVEAATNFVLDRLCIPTYSSGKTSAIFWDILGTVYTSFASSEAPLLQITIVTAMDKDQTCWDL